MSRPRRLKPKPEFLEVANCLEQLVSQTCRVPFSAQVRLATKVALTVRPSSPGTDSFTDSAHGLGLAKDCKVVVLRNQFGPGDDGRPAPRTPLVIYEPRLMQPLGRVRLEPVAAYEPCLTRPSEEGDDRRGRFLDIRGNRSAVLLRQACIDTPPALVAGRPELPQCWSAFASDPFAEAATVFEENPTTLGLAVQENIAVDEVWLKYGRELLRTPERHFVAWDRDRLADLARDRGAPLEVPAGFAASTAWPHEFFSREWDDDFLVHPANGRARPLGELVEGAATDGWAAVDGRWFPEAQVPDLLLSSPPRLGRSIRNPAFASLQALGFLPRLRPQDWLRSLSARDWADRMIVILATDHETTRRVLRAIRTAFLALGLDIEDVSAAKHFANPATPVTVADMAAIQVIRLSGAPSHETMTWPFVGLDCDLFDTGPWARAYEPVPPTAASALYAVRRKGSDKKPVSSVET